MTIDQFHSAIRELMNPGQGRYFPPETIDIAINNSIKDFYRVDYVHFEETQEITDTLGFFKAFAQSVVSNGNIDLPGDFFHATDTEAVLSDSTQAPLTMIKDGFWTIRKNSNGFPPTATYPIGRQFARKIEVLPVVSLGVVGVASINLHYLRKPAEVKFNYDESAGYGYVYVAAGSVDPDWPEIDHPRILMKALGYLGIPVQSQTLLQVEQIKKVSNNNA